MRSPFCVGTEVQRYDLEYVTATGETLPFWIEVKKHLNVGEVRRQQTAGWRAVRRPDAAPEKGKPEEKTAIEVDWQATTFARAEIYLTAWSIPNGDGTVLPLTRECIETLEPDVFALIEKQITDHIALMAAEKKAGAGPSLRAATSA